MQLFSCGSENKNDFDFSEIKKKLIPVHLKMGEPALGDWLQTHPEKNISLKQYIKLNPVRPDKKRNKIYIQPLGNFTAYELLLIETTAEYLETFYGLKTILQPKLSDSIIPKNNRRIGYNSIWITTTKGTTTSQCWKEVEIEQIQTKYVLYEILKPKLPNDATVMIALCNKDLYPDENYNFVFGQASLKDRVGVWSFARFGDPAEKGEFQNVLLRTLKTASHETGHMFSIKHCSRYHCIMNGSNHIDEADAKPTAFCPDCLEKFCWNFEVDPIVYFKRMKTFWEKQKEPMQVLRYSSMLEALEKK